MVNMEIIWVYIIILEHIVRTVVQMLWLEEVIIWKSYILIWDYYVNDWSYQFKKYIFDWLHSWYSYIYLRRLGVVLRNPIQCSQHRSFWFCFLVFQHAAHWKWKIIWISKVADKVADKSVAKWRTRSHRRNHMRWIQCIFVWL